MIDDDEIKEDIRSKVQSYIRMYGYLSQIITFSDIELEKVFVFLKYLNKKLPKREIDRFDITDTIDLDSLRIQKIHERIEELVPENSIIDPPVFDSSGIQEPEYDFLSDIISQVNKVYGVTLTDEDRLDLSRLTKRLIEDPEIDKFMNGNNSEDNKKNFFKEQFDGMMVDYINEKFDFYKKMDDNPSMKNLIFKMMYKDYNNQKGKSLHR